jgi:D-alanyl-lipoteichoic acid acyltransferase DltB (MBOAT superfamily)
LLLGWVLLLAVSAKTFLIFIAVSVVTYLGVAAALRWLPNHRRIALAVLIPLQLSPLLYYKYGGFLFSALEGWATLRPLDLIIPAGISFYTFQKIAFACDSLAFHKPMPRWLDFFNFAGFFPLIVAGPIERRDELLPQMERFRFRWLPADLDAGVGMIALGLFFKRVLADNFAYLFRPGDPANAWAIWIANILFGLRIYYDFAGYSLVAVGVARCLGVRLTFNFTSPYCSTGVSEFWRRWHITLSQWLRDYLYVPLGGGRVRWWWLNLLIVFLVSGLWHGAGWNFLFWGGLHGLFLITQRGWRGLRGERSSGAVAQAPRGSAAFFAWLLTMAAVFFAWLCFYETNSALLAQKLTTLFRPHAYRLSGLREVLIQWQGAQPFLLIIYGCLGALVLLLEWRSVRRETEPYAYLRSWYVLAVLIVLSFFLSTGENNEFIYFTF